MAAKPPVHDEAMLLVEVILRRGLIEPSTILSSVMDWLPMRRLVLSNAALQCVAAMFARGALLALHIRLSSTSAYRRTYCARVATQPTS